MTPEASAKNKIKKFLKSIKGCWFFMPNAGPFGLQGVPDIVGICDGDFFAIEVKAPGREKNTTANQDNNIEAIQRAGGLAFVASDVATCRTKFKAWGIHV